MRYRAFFSYARADDRVANWLHRQLDGYRTPKPLVGSDGELGPVPAKLHPIFRDRTDLESGGHVDAALQQALEDSETLIVLCTPTSAKSHWVNHEVETFLKLGREAMIFPVIAAGVPDSGDPETECFPPALRNKGLLAADLREIKLPTGQLIGDGREGGRLKLIAGLLGVKLDALVQRERRRQRMLVGGLGAAALVFAGLAVAAGGFWWLSNQRAEKIAQQTAEITQERDEATRQRDEARKQRGIADAKTAEAKDNLREAVAARRGEASARQRAEQRLAAAFSTRGEDELEAGRHASALRYALAGAAIAHGDSPEALDLLRRAQFGISSSGARALRAPPSSSASVDAYASDWSLAASCIDGRQIAIQRIADSSVLSRVDVPGCGPDSRRERGMSVKFSQDNKRLAWVGGQPRQMLVFDVTSGRCVSRIALSPDAFEYPYYNASMTRAYVYDLAAGSRRVALWDLEREHQLMTPTGLRGLRAMGLNHVYATTDGDVLVMDFGGRIRRRIDQSSAPHIYAVSPNEEWFVWSPINYGPAYLARMGAEEDIDLPAIRGAAFVGNGLLAIARWRQIAESVDVAQVDVLDEANPGGAPVFSAPFTETPGPRDIRALPSGKAIAGRYDGGVFTWAFDAAEPLNLPMDDPGSIAATVRQDRDFIAVVSKGETVYTFFAGRSYNKGPSPERLASIGFSPDGRELLFFARDRLVGRPVDTGRHEDERGKPRIFDRVKEVSLRGRTPQAVLHSQYASYSYLDVTTGRTVRIPRGGETDVDYSPTGSVRIVSVAGLPASTLRLESVATGKVLREVTVTGGYAGNVYLSADERHVLVNYFGPDRLSSGAEYWDLTNRRKIRTWDRFAIGWPPTMVGDRSAVVSIDYTGDAPTHLAAWGLDSGLRCRARIAFAGLNEMITAGEGRFVGLLRGFGAPDVQIIDTRDCTTVGHFQIGRNDIVKALDSAGRQLLVRSAGVTRVINTRTGRDLMSYASPSCVAEGGGNTVAFAPDDVRIVDICGGRYSVINAATGRILAQRSSGAPYALPFIYNAAAIRFDATGDRVAIFGEAGLGIDDISVTRQPLFALAKNACENHLTFGATRFSEAELRADPLLRDVWRTRSLEEQDVCAPGAF